MWNAAARGFALALALLLCAGCASVDPVVKIGVVAPFEGRHRDIGYDAVYSARLAVRQVNEAGGIGGYRVALVALDDRGDEELAKQAAASLAVDPGVVAVIGHYLPQTSGSALPVYEQNGLPFLQMGISPFTAGDPQDLPTEFTADYNALTPFDETPGPFAGPTYDAFGLLLAALAKAEENTGTITRSSVQESLDGLKYEGITGEVYQP